MRLLHVPRRTLALLAVLAPLVALFIYVALRSGPLAPVLVTVTTAEVRAIAPALSGIGTVQARYTYEIGPTYAGRIKSLSVDVGDSVEGGQVLGEMDPIDLDERIGAQESAIKRAEAILRQAEATQTFAQTQAHRYEQLLISHSTSEESVALKRHDLTIAGAIQDGARADLSRLRAELEALRAVRNNLRLVAPVTGLISARHANPGSTVVGGQAVIEIVDPASLWVHTRFDQISAEGLAPALPARIILRSRQSQNLRGHLQRVEPTADIVTEEMLAKVAIDTPLVPLPPIGELAEVTIQLPKVSPALTVPNVAIRRVDGELGVWMLADSELTFTPVTLGRYDLDGYVQVLTGLAEGDRIVVHSERTVYGYSRIRVVDQL